MSFRLLLENHWEESLNSINPTVLPLNNPCHQKHEEWQKKHRQDFVPNRADYIPVRGFAGISSFFYLWRKLDLFMFCFKEIYQLPTICSWGYEQSFAEHLADGIMCENLPCFGIHFEIAECISLCIIPYLFSEISEESFIWGIDNRCFCSSEY